MEAWIKSLYIIEEYGKDSKRRLIQQKNWMNVCKLGYEKNFFTVIVLQPILGTSDRTLSNHEHSIESGIFEENNLQYMKDFNFHSDDLLNTCSLMIDMGHAFDEINEPVFWDHGHTSDFGNKIISEKLFEKISPLIKTIN